MNSYYIGIDVGTGSARAALVKRDGTCVATSTQDIKTFRDPKDYRIFEQSTTDIWSCISKAIKETLKESGVAKEDIKGIGFDATCSLAVTDFEGNPICVTKGEGLGQEGDRNIVLWADHRAEKEAELINSTGSVVLDYVGGTMSLEMEVPKILWLKNHMNPDLFSRCQFFDLPDFLTYRATNDSTRSCCSVTCKCSFVPESGWQPEFFEKIGLPEFVHQKYRQMGAENMNVLAAGVPVGQGLSKQAAEELGLVEGTAVGSGLIDAYAGWLGTVAARYKENGEVSDVIPSVEESGHRLAAVAGTSTCHIVQSKTGILVNGVWGPYKDPIFRGWWMNEGGQSSTGQLIEFMLTTHHAYPELQRQAKEKQTNIHTLLDEILENLRKEAKVDSLIELTKDLHIYPDLHGNRSPLADPRMRGSIVGLELSSGVSDLAKRYRATLESIALQTRHIVDEMNAKGHSITSIYMSGGQAKNAALMQLFADTIGMPVVLPFSHSNAVVLGASMLGRFAAEATGLGQLSAEEHNKKLWNIMLEMTPQGTLVGPAATLKEKKLLQAKYKIYREAIDIQRKWRKEMEEASC